MCAYYLISASTRGLQKRVNTYIVLRKSLANMPRVPRTLQQRPTGPSTDSHGRKN